MKKMIYRLLVLCLVTMFVGFHVACKKEETKGATTDSTSSDFDLTALGFANCMTTWDQEGLILGIHSSDSVVSCFPADEEFNMLYFLFADGIMTDSLYALGDDIPESQLGVAMTQEQFDNGTFTTSVRSGEVEVFDYVEGEYIHFSYNLVLSNGQKLEDEYSDLICTPEF